MLITESEKKLENLSDSSSHAFIYCERVKRIFIDLLP